MIAIQLIAELEEAAFDHGFMAASNYYGKANIKGMDILRYEKSQKLILYIKTLEKAIEEGELK